MRAPRDQNFMIRWFRDLLCELIRRGPFSREILQQRAGCGV